jgi:hypothetical protein
MSTSSVPNAEFHKALGYFVVEFATFENALSAAVAYLANQADPRVGHILVCSLSFKALLSQFAVLYRHRIATVPTRPHGAHEAGLDAFLRAGHQSEEERNRLLHSFYRRGPVLEQTATRIKTTAKERNGPSIQSDTLSADDIITKARALAPVTAKLYRLMTRFPDYNRYLATFYAEYSAVARHTNDEPERTMGQTMG